MTSPTLAKEKADTLVTPRIHGNASWRICGMTSEHACMHEHQVLGAYVGEAAHDLGSDSKDGGGEGLVLVEHG